MLPASDAAGVGDRETFGEVSGDAVLEGDGDALGEDEGDADGVGVGDCDGDAVGDGVGRVGVGVIVPEAPFSFSGDVGVGVGVVGRGFTYVVQWAVQLRSRKSSV
jgi:hypothetical protein